MRSRLCPVFGENLPEFIVADAFGQRKEGRLGTRLQGVLNPKRVAITSVLATKAKRELPLLVVRVAFGRSHYEPYLIIRVDYSPRHRLRPRLGNEQREERRILYVLGDGSRGWPVEHG